MWPQFPVLVMDAADAPVGDPSFRVTDMGDVVGSCGGDANKRILRKARRRGLVILARWTSSLAARAKIVSLAAEVVERHLSLLLLRLDTDAECDPWPSHPATLVADVPPWAWPSLRTACFALAHHHPVLEDGKRWPLPPGPTQLLHVVGDRRFRTFVHDHDVAYDDGGEGERLLEPSEHCAIVLAGEGISSREVPHRWFAPALPRRSQRTEVFSFRHAKTMPSTLERHPLNTFDLGYRAAPLDESVVPPGGFANMMAENIAALHAVHHDWSRTMRLIKELERDLPASDGTMRVRHALLSAAVLYHLEHPPLWVSAELREMVTACRLLPRSERLHMEQNYGDLELHPEAKALPTPERPMLVACDADLEMPTPAFEDAEAGALHQAVTHVRWKKYRLPEGVRHDGFPWALWPYGARLPLEQPTMFVLLGSAKTTTAMAAELERMAPRIPCLRLLRGWDLDPNRGDAHSACDVVYAASLTEARAALGNPDKDAISDAAIGALQTLLPQTHKLPPADARPPPRASETGGEIIATKVRTWLAQLAPAEREVTEAWRFSRIQLIGGPSFVVSALHEPPASMSWEQALTHISSCRWARGAILDRVDGSEFRFSVFTSVGDGPPAKDKPKLSQE